MPAMEKHHKAGLRVKSVGGNNEKSREKATQCVPLQFPGKTRTGGYAEKGKMGKMPDTIRTGRELGTLGNCLDR